MQTDEHHRDVLMEHYKGGIQAAREIGLYALKTIITLNSGAFVVLLTFIGNTAAQSKFSVPLGALKCAMLSFVFGITLAFVSIAYTYAASQAASPYPRPQKKTDGWFLYIVTVIAGLALVAFLIGVILLVTSIEIAK